MTNSDSPINNENFLELIIRKDLDNGLKKNDLKFRFPPEPNGYLHIGHAKSICLNFEISKKYNGKCNLRFDDTNPEKENEEYIESIKEDVSWLGYKWDEIHFASDYFNDLYNFAIKLIQNDKAYIDSSSYENIKKERGTLKEPGKNSKDRERSKDESLKIFKEMRE